MNFDIRGKQGAVFIVYFFLLLIGLISYGIVLICAGNKIEDMANQRTDFVQ